MTRNFNFHALFAIVLAAALLGGMAVFAGGSYNDPYFSSQWPLAQANMACVMGLSPSLPIVVFDSGVPQDAHPDLRPPVAAWYSDIGFNTPYDGGAIGHGLRVASIFAATQNNAAYTTGALAGSPWYSMKVLYNDGSGSAGQLLRGIQLVDAALGNQRRIYVMSLGGPAPAQQSELEAAIAGGALVVAATGNEGAAAPSWPASVPGVLAVGGFARDSLLETASSNRGGAILAPGSSQYALYPDWHNTAGVVSSAGTSLAVPYVAAVAAALWDQNPSFSAQQVKDLLVSRSPSNSEGKKVLDACAAMGQQASTPTATATVAPSATATRTATATGTPVPTATATRTAAPTSTSATGTPVPTAQPTATTPTLRSNGVYIPLIVR